MKHQKLRAPKSLAQTLGLLGAVSLLAACGRSQPASAPLPAVAAPSPAAVDSEGRPVVETQETLGPDFDDAVTMPPSPEEAQETSATIQDGVIDAGAKVGYVLPDFQASWGLSRAVYDKAVTYMDLHARSFTNQRYVALVDMSKHSSVKRLFVFDLDTGKIEKHNVAHGSGSDPHATGYAKLFSNVGSSQKTALGAYKTAGTYYGKHGLQLRLAGLESTNSNALARGIVLHGASYVSDGGHAGRSWGCPAVDQHVAVGLIGRVKGGALFLIWK
jgi:hypothetical protein